MQQVAAPAAVLIATLAHYGHDNKEEASAAYKLAMQELKLEESQSQPQINPTDNFSGLNKALKDLRDLTPLQKPKLLKACAQSVLFDNRITADEGALLQGISAALDCPLPPSVIAKSRTESAATP